MLGRGLVVAARSSNKLLGSCNSSKGRGCLAAISSVSPVGQSYVHGDVSTRLVLEGGGVVWRSYSNTARRCKDADNNNNISSSSSSSSTQDDDYKIETMNCDLSEEEVRELMENEMAKAEEERVAKEYRDWVPGMRKRPLVMAYDQEAFNEDVVRWNGNLHRRIGVLAVKLGMMPVWDEWGQRHACTVLHVDRNVVMKTFTKEKGDGYNAVQIGAGEYKKKNVTKPLLGHYANCGVDHCPPYLVKEFRLQFYSSEQEFPEVGSTIHARHFTSGQNVDIIGITKGKGFQGAMKRHGFAGMPATHGTSKSHRALGSTGACQDPGKVWKGKKMAGRMGTDQVTTQNLRILKIDRGRDLIYVKGAVPGNKGQFVQVKDAIKKPLFGTDKVKDSILHPPIPTFPYDLEIDGSGQSGHVELMPSTDKDPFLPDEAELL
uniref:Large ribosomal subunit protein uL3m n=1 Tax=Eucampia antarctica TaxID=49252 RepID=A0A7S2RQJ9_9STRA|mmetsp:Transcript_25390/g.24329  ORF Transcript_25390/g.24329 Transcript_25390/m.24329 type:complete len:432 (+) Transcript_25390:175-1470(+)|eukprot:CAMPEP_0197834370 /NCGR_PEP_ID=MMETSP1437-20131217/22097_1 /TAXON_ID=49252 ORGANISM="Eucampia antarctica, Strain CCMP1452" /NCGR_SAMPLE_ID=MMETSP1437 /ASSEMBLY_ACC=CAM_ASM_001096 /LENGTH=431 /DNA_ID=CAMNT_0043438977 /DNA_START=145 /DNA_END=1440 /DNA_ORIENTATION=-